MTKDKILLCTGIFFPDVGGPAIHVMKIAERLAKEGFDVSVIAYGDCKETEHYDFKVYRISRKNHKIIQWLLYFIKVFQKTIRSKVVYAFDPTAAGVPGRISTMLLRKPFLIRVGGDPIWERIVEKKKRFITIQDFYKNKFHLKDNPFLFKVIGFVLSGAKKLVVYNQFFRDFYIEYFKVDPERIMVIKNPVFRRESKSNLKSENPSIVFAGRFVSYKNLPFLIHCFKQVSLKFKNLKLFLIGSGPEESELKQIVEQESLKESVVFEKSLPQSELFERIQSSWISIAPALNEFNPNFILESLSFGKPVLISEGHGLSVVLPSEFMFNPQEEDDLINKLENILDPEKYKEAVMKVSEIEMAQTWEQVGDAHLSLVKEVLK